ncbi:hypothetical protein G6F37_012132 [Rhizopus arrhizus]|nr:hypothetical protein G6F37_012132 [Rhizopus arrhizus]
MPILPVCVQLIYESSLAKEEEDRDAESEDFDSDSDEATGSSSSSSSDDDSSDEEPTSRRKTGLKEMKSRDSQSSRRKTIKSTESNHKSNKAKDNGKTNTQTSVDEVTSVMTNLTLLIQTQNNQQQSFLNQQPVSKQMNQNGFSPKLCYSCQGEGNLARDCRPCKHCKGGEGDHPFWECKLYSRRQTQVAQGGANSYLVFPGNHANENEDNKSANIEVYAAEKRPYSGSERDVRVARSGKKVKVRNSRQPAKEHKIANQSNHAFKPIIDERTPNVNNTHKQHEVSAKDEPSMLLGKTIEINDLKKAKVFTVSMEQLANSIKGSKTKLTKELRTPQKNPLSKVVKGAKVTSYYNSGPRNNLSKVRHYVEDPKERRGAPRVATIVAGMVEVPAVLDQGSHGTIMSVRLCDALGIDLTQAKPSKTRYTLADGSVASALKDLDEIMVQVQGVPVVIPWVSVLQHPAYDLLLGEGALDVLEIVTDHKRKHWTIRTDNGVEPLEIIWDRTNYIHKLETDENYSGDDEGDIENYSGYSDEESSEEYQQRESYLMMPLIPDGTNASSNIEPQESMAVESFLHERNQSNNMQGSSEEDICEAIEQSVECCEINEDQKKMLLKLLMRYKQVFGLEANQFIEAIY